MKPLLFIFLIFDIFLSVAAQTKRSKISKQTTIETSEKINYEPDADLLREMKGKVRIIELKQAWIKFDRQRPITNSSKTRAAYIAQFETKNEPDAVIDVIVVHDAKSDKFYEIRGFEDFSWRPSSEFRWINNDVLQFER